MAGKEQQLTDMLDATVEALGFELWGVEYLSQGRHSVLRIYIESDKGITVDDCAAVSAQVGSVLDVEDPITGEYTLEVSSPGVDRLLFKLEQYADYVGEMVELRLRSAFEGRRNFKGTLTGIEGEDVVVQVDDHEYLLPHGAVEKARVQPRVRMRALGASSLDFELLAWINHPELRGRVRHDLLMKIYKTLNEKGIKIPFPQTDIHVRSLPDTDK